MLSTKNIPDAKLPKTFGPGSIKAKINRIELEDGYNAGSYKVNLHLEGEDQGEDFEGFFIDAETKSGPRYKGQVGRVRMSRYDYADGQTKSGIPVKRDQNILRGLQHIAKAMGKQAELDAIEAETIEEYIPLASDLLSKDGTFLNVTVAGKEYQSGDYTNYELFIPIAPRGLVSFEDALTPIANSKLVPFDRAIHIIGKATAAPVESFEPTESAEPKDNFEL